MSLVESYAAERRARLVRLGAGPGPAVAAPKPEPKKRVQSIDASQFYPQMWMYDLVKPRPPKREVGSINVLGIRKAVCSYFKILPSDVESSRRQGALVYPRHLAFYLASAHTNCSYPQIGRRFGDRDHTTIMYGAKKISRLIKTDWEVAYDVAHLEAML